MDQIHATPELFAKGLIRKGNTLVKMKTRLEIEGSTKPVGRALVPVRRSKHVTRTEPCVKASEIILPHGAYGRDFIPGADMLMLDLEDKAIGPNPFEANYADTAIDDSCGVMEDADIDDVEIAFDTEGDDEREPIDVDDDMTPELGVAVYALSDGTAHIFSHEEYVERVDEIEINEQMFLDDLDMTYMSWIESIASTDIVMEEPEEEIENYHASPAPRFELENAAQRTNRCENIIAKMARRRGNSRKDLKEHRDFPLRELRYLKIRTPSQRGINTPWRGEANIWPVRIALQRNDVELADLPLCTEVEIRDKDGGNSVLCVGRRYSATSLKHRPTEVARNRERRSDRKWSPKRLFLRV